MFPARITSGLSIGKVLSGISKALSTINQMIPIYNQAKPMINNGKKILNTLKMININQDDVLDSNTKVIENKKTDNNNSPVFFS